MESSFSLGNWQLESFSTAELSPPVSPASPQSPLFYDGASNPSSPSNIKLAPQNQHQSQKQVALGSVLSSRAQAATNMLNELERLHYVEHQNAFGMSQSEESVDLNMDLFEELQDLEFTPPALPSSEDKFEVPSVSVSSSVPANNSIVQIIPNPPENDKLSAEYKSILESLNATGRINSNITNAVSSAFSVGAATTISSVAPRNNSVNVIGNYGGLFQGAGIPTTTVIGDECLVPVEFIGRPSADKIVIGGGGLGEEEAESMDLDGIIISDELGLINENELFSLGELSAELASEESNISSNGGNATVVNGVLPYWAKEMTIPLDSLDTEISRNNAALDALIRGDVSSAKNVITSGYSSPVALPAIEQGTYSPISAYASEDDDDDSMIEEVEQKAVQPAEVIPEPVVVVEAKKKPERRGRKPAKYNKDSLTFIKDKSLRKKEQNKTAATRYRQKKKEELAVTLAEEDELQEVHDDLEKQRDKLKNEVSVIRGLLREMLSARKQRVSPASTSITASSIVQAQRIARNNRK